jgi:hypothetical protein
MIVPVFILASCGSGEQKAGQKESGGTTGKDAGEVVSQPKMNADSLVTVINAERAKIENGLKSLQRTSLLTDNLREQIRQKWSKIEYYSGQGQILRIKTYPYEKISQRTEEFYFQDGSLILAFIEDQGATYTGKSENRVGKTYYFHDDVFVKEVNQTAEKETSIRTSDAERLLQEAKEYLGLFPKK